MFKDLRGKKFGFLSVVDVADRTPHGYKWKCICKCGKICFPLSANLLSGHTKSCGCLGNNNNFKHGYDKKGKRDRLYSIWAGMKTRTTNFKEKSAKHYCKRGVSCCPEWKSFIVFKDWALENGYTETLTLERIDVDGNYCPENCCWIPLKEQARNKRNTVKYKGFPVTKLCEEYGVNYHALMDKVYKAERKGIDRENVFKTTFPKTKADIKEFRK